MKGKEGQASFLAGMRNMSLLAFTFTGSDRATGSDRRSNRDFWTGKNSRSCMEVSWEGIKTMNMLA